MSELTNDPLLEYRDRFQGLDDCCYMVSHSLGAMPIQAATELNEFLELWLEKSITAWEDWLPEVDRAGARIAKLLSAPKGTVVMNTNVSSVMSVLASCFEYKGKRNKIVYTDMQFPTVSYVWKNEERLGARCHVVESDDGITVDTQKLIDAIDDTTVAVPISHVLFKSAYIQDAKAICQKANSVGAHVILDCYQSLGTIPVDIVDIGASFATGGSVKYMCGGPGAAYLYCRDDLTGKFEPRVTGWFGHESPFAFTMPEQHYAETTWRYMGGTPAIASLYQARAGAMLVNEVGVGNIRDKSQRLTEKIVAKVDERGFTLNSPRDPDTRGGSIVFDFVGSAAVARELNARHFYCDHRPAAGIRVAPHFYNKDDEIDLLFDEIDTIKTGQPRPS